MSSTLQVFKVNEQCKPCKGTGLYVGLAERDGAAVVCHKCKGTGCHTFQYEWTPFTGRQRRDDVTRVMQVNPGFVVGLNPEKDYHLSDFGGMPFDDWDAGKPFPPKSEMRRFACPAWWYQSADSSKMPHWDNCEWGVFRDCSSFPNKSACWCRWDKENAT